MEFCAQIMRCLVRKPYLVSGIALGLTLVACTPVRATENLSIPILVYHRFAPSVVDRMTVTISLFESHLEYLRSSGYQVILLKHLVQHRLSGKPALPSRAVVITADDGHRSVYEHLGGIARKYKLPVTLFVYPSAISNAEYALTWGQLAELRETGLFDIQSHSYWHPNFAQEKQRLTRREYEKLVNSQLEKSKATLETRLRSKVDMLAWPFGIYDDELIAQAKAAGYIAGFTIEGRHTTPRDPVMALPRYLVTQTYQRKLFVDIFERRAGPLVKGY
jgi:peptidoglycan/xylan/chitin deacetylase (PgdA/CDA1 family)